MRTQTSQLGLVVFIAFMAIVLRPSQAYALRSSPSAGETVPPIAGVPCLSLAEQKKLLQAARLALAKLSLNHEGQASGFMARTSAGKNLLVTAHHVPSTSVGEETCGTTSTTLSPAEELKRATLHHSLESVVARFSDGKVQQISFRVHPDAYDRSNDIVTADVGPRLASVSAQGSHINPKLYESILIMGFPAEKRGARMEHRCQFIGYGSSLTNSQKAAYALDCPINYDIAGMSGGLALSLCSGKAVGVVSSQEFNSDCPRIGNSRRVYLAPLSESSAGQLVFGIQTEDRHALCIREDERGREKIVACHIHPEIGFIDPD